MEEDKNMVKGLIEGFNKEIEKWKKEIKDMVGDTSKEKEKLKEDFKIEKIDELEKIKEEVNK